MPPPRIPFSTLLSRLRTQTMHSAFAFAVPTPRILKFLAKCFLFGHLFVRYIGTISHTDGISMVPTIPHSFYSRPQIIESRIHRRGRNIKVGDIITFTHPITPSEAACKRVIGMPGDYVSVMTPGRREEDLDKGEDEGEWARPKEEVFRVPAGHCWVAGDNLEWSRDSRVFGALPLGLVRGKVLGIIWPLGEFKWFGSGLRDFERGTHEWVVR